MNPFGLMLAACAVAHVAHTVLLEWDRAVDPGVCTDRLRYRRCHRADGMPVTYGWPAIPTRRGLDCSHGLQCARYLSRSDLRRPPGPAERHHWAKRRTLTRKAQRAFVATLGHRVGAPWDC